MINVKNYRFILFVLVAILAITTLLISLRDLELAPVVNNLRQGLGYPPKEVEETQPFIPVLDTLPWGTDNPAQPEPPMGQRFAFATFLSTRVANDSVDDKYFTATRVLAYQLLHRPETRTQKNIPFIVIVPPHVSEYKRKVLTEEGATVIPMELLNPSTWETSPGAPRWIDQFTKLRLFQLTQYDRIAYMDNDMLVTRPLDDIFDEETVKTPRETLSDPLKTDMEYTDPLALPNDYVIAGVVENGSASSKRPTPFHEGSILNGGFFVLRPDIKLFRYYESILEKPAPFDKGFMEMGLLNWAHRSSGEMPWTPLPLGKWCNNWPNWQDYLDGSATLHDKFWDEGNKGWIDRELVELWWRVQGQMEGYWQMQNLLRDMHTKNAGR